jgi:GNAT superfamily N-acetyltransferase
MQTTPRLRLLQPDDAEALAAGFERLSEASRYQRFFSATTRLSPTVLAYLTDLDGVDRAAVAALDPSRPSDVGTGEGLGIGIARYFRRADDGRVAEVAITVIDEYQGRGIGSLLFRALAAHAYQQGIREFRADVLTENRAVQQLLHAVGGTLRPGRDGSAYLEAVVPLEPPGAGLPAAVA